MKEKDINSLDHTTWRCQYHVVFAPKYRRLEIYVAIEADTGKILRQLCQKKGVEIKECSRQIIQGPFGGNNLYNVLLGFNQASGLVHLSRKSRHLKTP